MRVKPTRVRRLRIRRAIWRSAMSLCLGAGTVLYLQASGGSASGGQTPSARPIEVSPVSGTAEARGALAPAVPGRAKAVGVWAVEMPSLGTASSSAALPLGRLPGKAVRVVLKGKEHHVVTNAATVRQLLSAMGIVPDGNDLVTPLPRTPLKPGALVRYVKVSFKTVVSPGPVPFMTRTVYTSKLSPGRIRMIHGGDPGWGMLTYLEKLDNGRVISRTLVATNITRPPVDALREVGAAGAGHSQVGRASWYAHPGYTAASPWLPFGTVVRVTDLANGRSVTVVINDRGPFGGGVIDLSNEAFAALAPLSQGICQVRLTW